MTERDSESVNESLNMYRNGKKEGQPIWLPFFFGCTADTVRSTNEPMMTGDYGVVTCSAPNDPITWPSSKWALNLPATPVG